MDLMSIARFGADFNTIMFLITGILALRAVPFYDKRLKYFFAYILFTFVSSLVLYITRRGGPNIYLSYLITPVYLILFTLFLAPVKKKENTKNRSIIFGLMALGLVLNLYEAFLIDGGVNQYNSIANAYISIFLGTLAIGNLIKLRYDPLILNLSREPLFWIFIAIAIKNVGTLITTAFYRIVQGVDNDQLLKMVLASMAVNYLGIILYWIAFSKARKKTLRNPPKLAA